GPWRLRRVLGVFCERDRVIARRRRRVVHCPPWTKVHTARRRAGEAAIRRWRSVRLLLSARAKFGLSLAIGGTDEANRARQADQLPQGPGPGGDPRAERERRAGRHYRPRR